MSLAKRFAIAAAVIIGLTMLLLGAWVDAQIRHYVVQSAARSTALYMNSLIGPMVEDLGEAGSLSPEAAKALDGLLTGTALGRGIYAIKIWRRDGTVLFSSDKSIVGRRFADNEVVARAYLGEVVAELDDLSSAENEHERRLGVPLYEIYAPVRRTGTDQIVVVAELYENAENLSAGLAKSRSQTWLVTALATLAMFAALFGIVRQGSNMIDEQREALEAQLAEQKRLSAQNKELHGRIDQAHRRSAELNEHFMRRIGADLHDGPAQLLSYALLRLDDLAPLTTGKSAGQEAAILEAIRGAVGGALTELRNTSAGLGLPELARLSPAEALALAVRNHEQTTGSTVESQISGLPVHLEEARMTCLYRFAQEGLNNAFRHAGGRGQRLSARMEDDQLVAEIADTGPGFAIGDLEKSSGRFGLAGLRYRIEALGGRFEMLSAPGSGTRLTLRLPLGKGEIGPI